MYARKFAIAAVAIAATVAAASVEARGRDDVQLSVTIGSPAWSVRPMPVSERPGPGRAPRPRIPPRAGTARRPAGTATATASRTATTASTTRAGTATATASRTATTAATTGASAPTAAARPLVALALLDPAGLVEGQPRAAREQLRRVAVAEVADEVGADRRSGPERLVDLRVVEAAHRPAVEAERPRRDDEVAALQAGVAKRGGFDDFLPCRRTTPARRRAGTAAAASRRTPCPCRRSPSPAPARVFSTLPGETQPSSLSLAPAERDEDESRRRAVGRGRPPLHQVVELAQRRVGDRLGEVAVVGARAVEELLGADDHGGGRAPSGIRMRELWGFGTSTDRNAFVDSVQAREGWPTIADVRPVPHDVSAFFARLGEASRASCR